MFSSTRQIIIAAIWAFTCACQGTPGPAEQTPDPKSDTLAMVGIQPITLTDLQGEIDRHNPALRSRYRSPAMRKQLLNEMIEREAFALEARRLGLDRDGEVQDQYKQMLVNHLVAKIRKERFARIDISEADIERYWRENIEHFKKPAKVSIFQIFFAFNQTDPSSRAKARKRAEDVLKSLREHKGDLLFVKEQAAKNASRPGTADSGGDLGFKSRSELETTFGKPFATAAFSLESDKALSDLVETDKGFYILYRSGSQAAANIPFEQAKKSIRGTLLSQARNDVYDAFVKEVTARTPVEIFPNIMAKAEVRQDQSPEEGTATPDSGRRLRVLTDRTESHLEDIFKYFEQAHGIRIEVNFVGDGLLERLQRRPQEADLIVTKNAVLLELAKQKHLLGKFSDPGIFNNVPPVFRDTENFYTILSFRARAIYMSKERVALTDVSAYSDLTAPRWAGRVCIRSGFHEYNLSLFSQMAVSEGLEKTEHFIQSLANNLARPPKGNDREQVRAILENTCDLAVVNSYYMGIMLQDKDQKAWALSSRVMFPDQNDRGTYVMRSGAALTTARSNEDIANRLLVFLTGAFAQRYFSEALFEYPVMQGIELSGINAAMGTEQGIQGGAFKVNLVALPEAVKYRQKIIEFLNRINFDRK